MRNIFTFILAACMSIFSCNEAVTGNDITVHPKKILAPVSPLFWGTNFLFWIEDDASLQDGLIEKALTDLPCTILRYPAGTAADNYHWETGLLDNAAVYPFEGGDSETGFEEFMAVCSRIGAEPMIVVNTESWYIRGDVEGGAAEAARWVRYCKEKGYNVRYWEIGNETYWRPFMTAREYGRLCRIYAQAMKAEDPSIILSVVGNWDVEMTGTKERIPSELHEKIRQDWLKISSREEHDALRDFIKGNTEKPLTKGSEKWWPNLIGECGDCIDMVSVHWYYFDEKVGSIDTEIMKVKKLLKELKPGKDYLFCLSEYNCNTPQLPLRMTGLAESLGRFLNCGIDISTFWPLRIGGNSSRAMLNIKTKAAQYPYQIFQMLERDLKGNMVLCDSPGDMFAYASRDSRSETVVISGRRLKEDRTVTVGTGLPGRYKAAVTLYALDGETGSIAPTECVWSSARGQVTLEVKPGTFAEIVLNR